ncbi:tetratricopeptide repeat protein [Pseudomonas japonica]|uniref:tetratricopeptide repeat protein n=1 Tax=Pseudomonas japonica TaxID=256466 RepID=UPI0015E447EF|nr:tetratricopeptide repeat protein [Pseudomonas japonica]MBA1242243.1 tetratricopeptide repeat protein [Pseudomonas japonica]
MTRASRLSSIIGLALLAGAVIWLLSAPPQPQVQSLAPRSYTEALRAARGGEPGAARRLYQQLARDDLAPGARAALYGPLPDYPSPRALVFAHQGLTDPAPVVRHAALTALVRLLPTAAQADALGPLLSDPDESVRTAAAQALLELGAAGTGEYAHRLDEVLNTWAGQLASMPHDYSAQLQLARLLLQRGAPEQAETAARTVLALHPDHLPARVLLARALDQRGKPDEARAVLAEPLRQHPDDAFLQHELGLWLLGHGEPAFALLALAKAVELAPEVADYRFDLATTLHSLDQPDAAQAQLDQLVRRHPENRKARMLLIDYWQQSGQLQNVQVLLAELEQQNPDDPAVQQGL